MAAQEAVNFDFLLFDDEQEVLSLAELNTAAVAEPGSKWFVQPNQEIKEAQRFWNSSVRVYRFSLVKPKDWFF